MTEAEKKALAIYEKIVTCSGDRPFAFDSMEQMRVQTAAWKAKNAALSELSRAKPEVQLAFLDHCFEWLVAEALVPQNFRVVMSLSEVIQQALTDAPKPLPASLVCHLLKQYRQQLASMAHIYFPFPHLLSLLSRDQVTEEMRGELQKLSMYFTPSPTGKMDETVRITRDRIAELARVEGEKRLEPGRGPWSQLVFDEINGKEEITRAGWEGLLGHCGELEMAVPGAKWKKRSREMITILGEAEVYPAMLRWLALRPTPGQPPEARSPIEDSAYQKGVVWCLAQRDDREAALAVADFGVACLRKIRVLGAVSQKVGFACVQALGAMDCSEAVEQLTRLRAKVKYNVARRLIEKSLKQAAERSGLSVQELEDVSVGNYGLNAQGEAKFEIGDASAIVRLSDDGRADVVWRNADGKLKKSAPSNIKKAFPKEVRAAASLAKELEEAYFAQRTRLESSFLSQKGMPLAHWRTFFIEHPLLGFLGRKLIWVFRNEDGGERSAIWSGKELIDSHGKPVDAGATQTVRLWHPLATDAKEIQRWREHVHKAKIRQPFRQAFREFYEITDEERQTKMYSNRFAKVIMRQHQFASLCRTRGWNYRLMGANFDGGNTPTKKFDAWNARVEFFVDIPSDRDRSLLESAFGEQSGAGINIFIVSDQMRFYRDNHEIALDEVPAILYSEVMRDVDLFTSVSSVGIDETWADQGDRGMGIFGDDFDIRKLSGLIALRREMVSLALPHAGIQDRCTIHDNWLEVKGQLGTYRIHFAWAGGALVTESTVRWLRIPRKLLDAVPLDFSTSSAEPDYRSETILRTAYIMANDWKIDSPELIRQLMPPEK